jgi:hypothetical protein
MEGMEVSSASTSDEGAEDIDQTGADAKPVGLTVGAVLAYLQSNGATSIPQIATALQSPLLDAAQMLATLASSGLVVIEGTPGAESVRLTPAGDTLSTVA